MDRGLDSLIKLALTVLIFVVPAILSAMEKSKKAAKRRSLPDPPRPAETRRPATARTAFDEPAESGPARGKSLAEWVEELRRNAETGPVAAPTPAEPARTETARKAAEPKRSEPAPRVARSSPAPTPVVTRAEPGPSAEILRHLEATKVAPSRSAVVPPSRGRTIVRAGTLADAFVLAEILQPCIAMRGGHRGPPPGFPTPGAGSQPVAEGKP